MYKILFFLLDIRISPGKENSENVSGFSRPEFYNFITYFATL